MIMLGSNNYLSLTNDQRVIEAGIDALQKFGTGVSGSRLLNGTTVLHEQLEKSLADFLGKKACLVLSTGYSANLGFLSAIAGRDDVIFCDRENHASIYDGIKLGNAQIVRYYHNDMRDLEEKMIAAGDSGKLVVTDGVFSMSGDICKLPEIITLAKKYHARVMVDDAHGLGVLGKFGRGTGEFFGLENEVDVVMGTFSKSLGSVGGFLAASSPEVIEYIKHTSRPFIFCAALPPANIACAQKALEIVQQEPWRHEKLLKLSAYMRKKLLDANVPILNPTGITPIVAVITGKKMRTLAICRWLFNNGVFVNPVLPPASPNDKCIIRLSLQTNCTEELVDVAINTLFKAMDEIPDDESKVVQLLNLG